MILSTLLNRTRSVVTESKITRMLEGGILSLFVLRWLFNIIFGLLCANPTATIKPRNKICFFGVGLLFCCLVDFSAKQFQYMKKHVPTMKDRTLV